VQASRSGSAPTISAVQLSEWLHDVVQELLAGKLAQLRGAVDRALAALRDVAEELGSSETPSAEEIERMLRDAPRFEFAALPDEFHPGRWKWLGAGMLRSAVTRHMEGSIGPVLKEELHLYGRALSQWSDQTLKKIEAFLNSYADAYRIQIHRVSGLSEAVKDLPKMQSDLNLLRSWRAEETPDPVRKRA
jgi:hypothetical protein